MSLTESKSFVQYKYCCLCHTSCKKFKKHVHSQGHQKIVKNILAKFSKKITDAKMYLHEPVLKDIIWEQADKQLWCYFCQLDISQHLRQSTAEGDCIILAGGFLGHMTREDHLENTKKFLKENVVDMSRTPDFILTSDTFLRFMEKVEKTATNFFNERKWKLRRVAVSIEDQNVRRREIVAQGLLDQSFSQQSHGPRLYAVPVENPSVKSTDGAELTGKKTIRAFGVGMTVIERQDEDDTRGNVHSNAVPPWLQEDLEEGTDKNRTIGPSLSDFQKYKKLEKKKQLPAIRVGAKFNRADTHSDDWLPNFGGVWSKGPRTKAGHQFHRRQNQNHLSQIKVKEGPTTSRNLNQHYHRSSVPDNITESSSGIPSHLRASTSRGITGEVPDSEAVIKLDSASFLGQGIQPYISKKQRRLANVEPSSDNNMGRESLYLPSTVSQDCLSFSSSLNDDSYKSSVSPAGVYSQPVTNRSRLPLESKSSALSPSFQLLPTPVLSAKKRKL